MVASGKGSLVYELLRGLAMHGMYLVLVCASSLGRMSSLFITFPVLRFAVHEFFGLAQTSWGQGGTRSEEKHLLVSASICARPCVRVNVCLRSRKSCVYMTRQLMCRRSKRKKRSTRTQRRRRPRRQMCVTKVVLTNWRWGGKQRTRRRVRLQPCRISICLCLHILTARGILEADAAAPNRPICL